MVMPLLLIWWPPSTLCIYHLPTIHDTNNYVGGRIGMLKRIDLFVVMYAIGMLSLFMHNFIIMND